MPTWQGMKFRWRRISEALTRPYLEIVAYPCSRTSAFDFLQPWLQNLPQPPRELDRDPAELAPGAAVEESSELEVARTLYSLARVMNAERVVEVGVYRGFTSAFLAAAVAPNHGTLYLVDLSEAALAKAVERSKPYEIKVMQSCGLSTDGVVLDQVPAGVDLIYLDADHSESGVSAELEVWWPKLRPGGVVAIHDAVNIPGVCRAVNRWANRFPCLTVATGRGSGLAMLRKDGSR